MCNSYAAIDIRGCTFSLHRMAGRQDRPALAIGASTRLQSTISLANRAVGTRGALAGPAHPLD